MKYLLSTLLFVMAVVGGAFGQTNYQLMDNSTMKIAGTSTIHDWECDVEEINASISLDEASLNMESKSSPVQSLVLNIPVEKIESGKGGMNKKIYDALKEKRHPNITFELTSSEIALSGTNGNEGHLQLATNGKLTVAGTSQEISFPVDGYIHSDGSYKFTGSYEINMKDYNVDPPSAMFGTIKSGEMVTVSFEFYLSNELAR